MHRVPASLCHPVDYYLTSSSHAHCFFGDQCMYSLDIKTIGGLLQLRLRSPVWSSLPFCGGSSYARWMLADAQTSKLYCVLIWHLFICGWCTVKPIPFEMSDSSIRNIRSILCNLHTCASVKISFGGWDTGKNRSWDFLLEMIIEHCKIWSHFHFWKIKRLGVRSNTLAPFVLMKLAWSALYQTKWPFFKTFLFAPQCHYWANGQSDTGRFFLPTL